MLLAPISQLFPPRVLLLRHLSSSFPYNPPWLLSWAPRPLPKRVPSALDYRAALSSDDDEAGTSRSAGSSTMRRILSRLETLGYLPAPLHPSSPSLPEKGSVEDVFYAEDGMLPDSRGGLSLDFTGDVRFPWEKPHPEVREVLERKKRSKAWLAELTLPEAELRRLRHLALRVKSRVKVKGRGVSSEIVDEIHGRWKTEEVVRIKCEGNAALNMKRVHELLERRTGGLVIWRSGTSISLYRGVSYDKPQVEKKNYLTSQVGVDSLKKDAYMPSEEPLQNDQDGDMVDPPENLVGSAEKKKLVKLPPRLDYEHEVDKLLDDLGPRYTDWPGGDLLPVDADLLPSVVPGYKPPFRVLPYGVRSSLGRKEGTALRRLARLLPPHFALGRSRRHEGLAAAMVKLWERSSIAKIALKRGVQLTTSERMAEDIKKLTGGTLLSRSKDFLVFYRGKDFLSSEVAEALIERERLAKVLQDKEDQARLRASSSVVFNIEAIEQPGTAGTLEETLEADARWAAKLDEYHEKKMRTAVEVARHAKLVRRLERKLSLAERKITKAKNALAKVEESLKPLERTSEPESITEEERFMFRKLGLRMKAFLLLGRRGVFDGTVENMHLHWKYRELVKVMVNAKTFAEVKNIALSLEAESGGVLVSVDKISKKFAIIVYRGKDYKRPSSLRPKNLLTKRKALARSIELQRHEALNLHIANLNKRVEKLKSELDQMEKVKDKGDEDLYAKLDSAYATEQEETEDEGDDAYLDSFNSAMADNDADVDVDGSEDANFDNSDEDIEDTRDRSYDVVDDGDGNYFLDTFEPYLNFTHDEPET